MKLLFLNLLLWVGSLNATNTVVIPEADSIYRIGRSLSYLKDTENNLRIENFLNDSLSEPFIQSSTQNPSFGFSRSAYWVHFNLVNESSSAYKWYLKGPMIMDEMTVYFIFPGKKVIVRKAGNSIPLYKRDLRSKENMVIIPFERSKNLQVFIRFKSERQMAFPVTVLTETSFWSEERQEMLLSGLYFGVLFVMIFYNLFLFISLREKGYLYYVLYISCFTIAQLFEQGIGYEFFPSRLTAPYKHITLFFNTLTLISAINFSREFLNSKKIFFRIDRVLKIYILLAGVVLVFIIINRVPWALGLGNPLILLSILTILGSALYAYIRGYGQAKYFLTGWLFLMFGIVINILKSAGVVPYNFLTVNSMQISSVFEVVLFSFALGDRINQVKKEQALLKDRLNKELEIKVIERTREISIQKEIIETKNKDITDSINYAQRIQKAMLPEIANIKRCFPESFVLYMPRDIVSGDFFWFHEQEGVNKEQKILFLAAADCTGHGVPGAFMSLIGTSLLQKVVVEKSIMNPSLILTELDKEIRSSLKQDKEDGSRDGMDIALCSWELLSDKIIVRYSGANRPLYHVKKGVLAEYRPDKFAIGGFADNLEKRFSEQIIEIEQGDTLYLFSDGYPDQFGGEEGKKYMTKRLKSFLSEISSQAMEEQKTLLEQNILTWIGNENEQIDDILVIGVRF